MNIMLVLKKNLPAGLYPKLQEIIPQRPNTMWVQVNTNTLMAIKKLLIRRLLIILELKQKNSNTILIQFLAQDLIKDNF